MMSWPYIAGFFDGEGSVSVRWRQHTQSTAFTVQLCQAGKRGETVLRRMKEFMSPLGILSHVYSEQKPSGISKQVMHRLQISSRKNVIPFLKQVLPFTHVKKVISQDAVRYNALFPAMRGGQKP